MPRTQNSGQAPGLCQRVLPLANATLSEEYRYLSLSLCVLDAVFSINAKYDSTRQVVIRYCEYTGQDRIRPSAGLAPQAHQESISAFCSRPEQTNPEAMATDVYRNRQRTSTRGGLLKADAALRFARVLQSFGVEYLQDVPKVSNDAAFQNAICAIPGQRSGVSLQYFWMLAGSDAFIKPDRMVIRFLETAVGRVVHVTEAPTLLRGASDLLRRDFPEMTPRLLDHEVWKYQRGSVKTA